MLKMTGFDVLFAAAGNLYLLLALGGICVALWGGKTWVRKLTYASLVLALFVAPIAPEIYRTIEYRGKLAKGQALFEERCKTAGEKIYRTADGVAGVLLLKQRPKTINLSDQYRLDDPFGSDCHGDECIVELLQATTGNERNPALSERLSSGFSYVDVIDSVDGQRYRYQGVIAADTAHRLSLQRTVTTAPPPFFGITWDDISTREDRDYWIAGGVLKVVDIKSGEVIGERRGYMMDKGQGNQDGGRSPWAFAYDNACPKLPTVADGRAFRGGHSRKFIFSALKAQEGKQ